MKCAQTHGTDSPGILMDIDKQNKVKNRNNGVKIKKYYKGSDI